MKREIWEELVDCVVDDECAVEEKRALYEAAERNPEIREALDAALRIRELMRRSAGATVPPEFSERLRLAIERSDFWVEREVERPAVRPASTTATRRFGGRRFAWATTGAAISFAAVALLALNVVERGGVETALVDESANVSATAAEKKDGGTFENGGEPAQFEPSTARPAFLLRPGNKGEAPKEPDVATPSGFYTRRTVDSGNAKRILAEFVRICRQNDVLYEKIKGDFELTLLDTTPEARRAILAWLDANAQKSEDRGETKLDERWDETDESVCDVRVSFDVAKSE